MYPYLTNFKHKLTMIDTFIFIGMAGVGKSTIGSAIAKKFNLKFYDVDSVIVQKFNTPINKLIEEKGAQEFKKIESNSVLELVGNNNVLAPGGSFIYSTEVIEKIKDRTLFILLYDNPDRIKKRINNLETRGIIGMETKSFEDIYYERMNLYKQVGNVQFNLEFQSFKAACDNISAYFNTFI